MSYMLRAEPAGYNLTTRAPHRTLRLAIAAAKRAARLRPGVRIAVVWANDRRVPKVWMAYAYADPLSAKIAVEHTEAGAAALAQEGTAP